MFLLKKVDVGLIMFQHHHLFSLEHHLSTKLVDAYHAYTKIRSIQASKGLDNRINVLYRSLDELKSKKDSWTEEEKEFQVIYFYSYVHWYNGFTFGKTFIP